VGVCLGMVYFFLRTAEGLGLQSHTGVPEIDPRAKPSAVSPWRLSVIEIRGGRGALFFLLADLISYLNNVAHRGLAWGWGRFLVPQYETAAPSQTSALSRTPHQP